MAVIYIYMYIYDHASAITMHIKIASLVFKILLHALVCILSHVRNKGGWIHIWILACSGQRKVFMFLQKIRL